MTENQENLLTQGDPINGGKCVKVVVTASQLGASVTESTAYGKSKIIKAAPGTLLQLSGYNSGGAQFIQLHDSATLPADTAVPKRLISVAATSTFSFLLPVTGLTFSKGIVVAASSTGPTLTLDASNDVWFQADFI